MRNFILNSNSFLDKSLKIGAHMDWICRTSVKPFTTCAVQIAHGGGPKYPRADGKCPKRVLLAFWRCFHTSGVK